MQQADLKLSKRTIVISSVRLVVFAIGVALILAFVVCLGMAALGIEHDAVEKVFGWVLVLFVYDAGAMVLLRIALAFSVRRDRAS